MDEIKKLPSGKLSPKALERNILRYVGAERKELLIGPAVGEDAAVIEWPRGKYLVFSSDPIVGAEKGAGKEGHHLKKEQEPEHEIGSGEDNFLKENSYEKDDFPS